MSYNYEINHNVQKKKSDNSKYTYRNNEIDSQTYIFELALKDKFNENLNLNLRLNNVFDKDYSLAAEGASGFRYQTPGRSLFANLRYDF